MVCARGRAGSRTASKKIPFGLHSCSLLHFFYLYTFLFRVGKRISSIFLRLLTGFLRTAVQSVHTVRRLHVYVCVPCESRHVRCCGLKD